MKGITQGLNRSLKETTGHLKNWKEGDQEWNWKAGKIVE